MSPEYSTQPATNGKPLEQDFITFLGIYSTNRLPHGVMNSTDI
jgi:hypothetical protein